MTRLADLLNSYQRARILMLGGAAASFALFSIGARYLHLQSTPGYNASLLLQQSPVAVVMVSVVLFAASALVGTALAGAIRFNAGLLTACVGLAALSIRGGSAQYTIFTALGRAGGPGLFLVYLFELIMLSVLAGVVWVVLRGLHGAGKLQDREGPPLLDPEHPRKESAALVVQFVITFVGVCLLAASDAKQQVLAAIFIASFAGSAISHSSFDTGPRGWYWLPPLLVGVAGYLLAYLSPPDGIATANLTWTFAALARPVPLDYASAGPAGAIIGHWMSRRWQKEREALGQAAGAA